MSPELGGVTVEGDFGTVGATQLRAEARRGSHCARPAQPIPGTLDRQVEGSSQLFAYALMLDGDRLFLLWRDGGDSADEVLVQDDETIPLFETVATARAEAAPSEPFSDDTNEVPLDLDAVRAWCSSPTAATLDCGLVLNAWNLFADVVAIRNHPDFRVLDARAGHAYDKLFFGCNLPAVTPEGESYEPEWSQEEVEQIRGILAAGFDLFIPRVRRWRSN